MDQPGAVACNDAEQPPSFLITIDTEGDNLWSRPSEITTRNSRFLPRFQELCDRFRFPPVWLTNHEMVQCPVFREFGRDVTQRGTGEIGMHLHAWNSPPIVPLTSDDYRYQPFLIDYPDQVMADKIRRLTADLEDTFERKVVSHRAGRWAMDQRYATLLAENGYLVDCSVTPYVSWSTVRGNPDGRGGSDYRNAPECAYRLHPTDVCQAGDSGLLEVPMTIRPVRRSGPVKGLSRLAQSVPGRLARRATKAIFPDVAWLRPNGRNLRSMCRLLDDARHRGDRFVEFMLHSSEFMPGGSPRFPGHRSIERLYRHLEALFAYATGLGFRGRTLSEFHRDLSGNDNK